MVNLTQQDELDIADSVEPETNVSEEHTLSTVAPKTLGQATAFRGVDIQGMESVPMSMTAIPYVRLIQPTSKETEMANGKEAPLGSFLFNDIQEAFSDLDFILLRAKHEMRPFEQDGVTTLKPRVALLGVTMDSEKLFILSLSATSFSNFGRLIAKFKSLQVDKTWRFILKLTSEKVENRKGKFYIANIQIGKELTGQELKTMEAKALEYGVVLDRQPIEEEE